jgi:hypothetical protein
MVFCAVVATACTADSSRGHEIAGSPPASSPTPSDSTPTPATDDNSADRRSHDKTPFLRVVGHHPLGGDGYNADVYALGDFAYVGDMGQGPESGLPCPSDGVKAVDISTPSKPRLAAVLHHPGNTSAEDVVVQHVETQAFQGDLAVTGIQACDKTLPGSRGLLFFDVTDPYKPKKLGSWEAPSGSRGCHEIDMELTSAHRALVACANPEAAANLGADEVALVDASDPRSPRPVGGFTLDQSDGPRSRYEYGCLPRSFAHSVRFFDHGTRLYASYWDAGTVLLDVAQPADPRLLGVTWPGRHSDDGDDHSMTLADDGRLLLINSEDVSPNPEVFHLDCAARDGDQWGQLTIYDNRDPSRARYIGSFGTTHSREPATNGVYTVHNTEIVAGDQAFSSWYSDGVRWIDLANPSKPREVAHFLPPRMRDPGGNLPPSPFVWGLWPDQHGGVILVSDINSGLWILRPVGLDDF